jgi:3-dehydroquinate dehydratase type I
MKICACIAARDAAGFARAVSAAKKSGAEMAEHRLDAMKNPPGVSGLGKMYAKAGLPVIAACRRKPDRGSFAGSEEARAELLCSAIAAGASCVDVELDSGPAFRKRVLSAAKAAGCAAIISHHDYSGTPGMQALVSALAAMMEQGAQAGKIVTAANSASDCHRVLGLMLLAREKNFPLVAFCMGREGAWTRVAAAHYGAPFMYASVPGTTGTAPGQLDCRRLFGMLSELGK